MRSFSLFLFAHQDDEFLARPFIRDEMEAGRTPLFFYLTDGETAAADGLRRNRETLNALAHAGVDEEDVFFAGTQCAIPDGRLFQHLPAAWEALLAHLDKRLGGARVGRIVALAWEGGHHDHDCVSAIAHCLAARLAGRPEVLEIPFYNARGMLPGLPGFNAPVAGTPPMRRRRVRFGEFLTVCRSAWFYKTQFRAFCVLLPFFVLSYCLKRGVLYRMATPPDAAARPHPGTLWYEKRYRVKFGEVSEKILAFQKAAASERAAL